MSRHTQAIINLSHIKSNYEMANQWAPRSKNMAIIKANAYGHGLVEVAQALESIVPAFGVAIFDEAVELRKAEIKKNILILQGISSVEELNYACENDLWITIHNRVQLDLLLSTPHERAISIWLKFDTGMHRLGFSKSELRGVLEQTKACKWINEKVVISSHFSCASEFYNKETARQLEQFTDTLFFVNGDENIELSFANSPAIAHLPSANFDWNRPGIMLYGLPLFDICHESDEHLIPAMTFESRVIGIREVKKGDFVGYSKKWRAERDSKIATIEVGYADGYPRQAKNGTPVLINGQRAKLAGIVSMDLISVDVTDIVNARMGDLVELWGENLCANEVASYADTIGYDLISGVSQRVPRNYRN